MKTRLTTCPECFGTGFGHNGVLCGACRHNGLETLREVTLGAINKVFDEALQRGDVPSSGAVEYAARWAMSPKTTYAAGFRGDDGAWSMFSGPSPKLADAIENPPPPDTMGRKAFVVKLVKITYGGKPLLTPVARWKNERWQVKKER